MKSMKVLAIVAGSTGMLWGSALLAAQPGAFGAGAQGRPADYMQTCKVAPTPAGPPPARPAGAPPPPPATYDAKEYTVTAIPGVIAAGARWSPVWNGDGNNADGLVATSDGGMYFVQNDGNRIGKIDRKGQVTWSYTDLNVSGSMAMNSKGALFVLNRGYTGLSGTAKGFASIEQLAPKKKVLADKGPNGDALDCVGGVLNDAVAASNGGVYFTMAGVNYAAPDGKVSKQDAKDGNPRLNTNGIILTPDEKHVIVTSAGSLTIFDVGADGQLSNQRKFADLDRTGLAEGQGAGGDGAAFDSVGRYYVTAVNGVQVFDKDGKHLGTIPAPRNLVSVAIGGPNRKTMYSVTAANVDGQRKVWIESIPLLATGPKGRGK
ncbi:MAG: SMP-30/gluconolactonase/LRE family protein [Steroidobacteraceae bacterium]